MCRLASFLHNPVTGDVFVRDINSHSETEKCAPKGLWREGHYLPTGEVEARVAPEDHQTQAECTACVKDRWPRFVDFLGWCWTQPGVLDKGVFSGGLDLRRLTSAVDLKLPTTVSGELDLRGLTSAVGLKLPTTVSGWLDLRENVRSELGKREPKNER